MNPIKALPLLVLFGTAAIGHCAAQDNRVDKAVDKAKPVDARDYAQWILPKQPAYPANNAPTEARVELGKMLFFDPRLSRDGNISCASCHNPSLGWSDGLATGRGFEGKLLGRASPTIVNAGYNTIHMWDGRKKTLEDQAIGPMEAAAEMNTDLARFFAWMNASAGYKAAFAKAYPGEPIGADTLKRAIASFERTIVSRTSPFDRWVGGDKLAMAPQQLRGMALFNDKEKTNCVACHAAPNFTDNGFHNLGLASFGSDKPDLGRYAQKPVASMKGAFKTPGLRDVERTAPYFHDGSAKTLMEVVEHYAKGGAVRTNVSPDMKQLSLAQADKEDLVAFLKALSSPATPMTYPVLPQD
jgi:cytochrome c peroxidase